MKNRKFIALIIAFLLFMTNLIPITTFAEKLSKEAKACADLGILIGTDPTEGVTSSYLATSPSRIQALIIFLRIQGLEDEALDYTGLDNFKDAKSLQWIEGRNYLAYAKDNPSMGWIGNTKGEFLHSQKIDGKAFYKVMLETLGYKQDRDFTYNETLKFAESIKLISKASSIEKLKEFTVEDVSKAIYNTLDTKPKGETKKLISIMIDKGIIDEAKAAEAKFEIELETVKVNSFERLSNNKFLVELDKEFPIEEKDISIIPEDGDKKIQVTSVNSSGKKTYITTAYMNAFTPYNISINTKIPVNGMAIKGYNARFVALPRDTEKPKATAEIINNNIIRVIFNEEVDRTSAEDVDNYTIENYLSINSAKLDETGKIVTLTTASHRENDRYWLTIKNVSDLAGNVMDTYEKSYRGMPRDTIRPYIVSIQVDSNKSILINFNEPLNKITAERLENYSFDKDALTVENATLDSNGKTVRIETSNQKPGNIYRIIVKNIADLSDNVMYEVTKSLSGSSDSTIDLSVLSAVAYSSNEVEIKFNKALDKESAENIFNYTIDDIDVQNAFLSTDGKVLTLITSDQKAATKYKLQIENVKDIYGNALSYNPGYFIGKSKDSTPLSYQVRSDKNSLIITFNKRVDRKSAENVFNYILDKSMGYAAKATLDVDKTGRTVTLLTKAQENGKIYNLSIENVTDLSGTPISTDEKICKKTFLGFGTKDTEGLNLQAINAANTSTIDLYFSNSLTKEELEDLEITITREDNEEFDEPKGLKYEKYFYIDKSTVRVQFKTNASMTPDLFKSGRLYEVRASNIDRLYESSSANIKAFAGTDETSQPPYITDVYAVNSTAIEVTFSQPVKGIAPSQFSISGANITGTSVAIDEVTSTAMLYLNNNSALKDNKSYTLMARSGIKDAAGYNSISTKAGLNSIEFYGTSYKNEAPYAIEDSVIVYDKYTFSIEFNEPIKLPASSGFSIRRYPSGGGALVVSEVKLSEDKTTATIYLNSANAPLSSDYDYEMTLNSNITDLQGLSLDSSSRKIDLYGSDVDLSQFEIIAQSVGADNKTITLVTNNIIKNTNIGMDCFEISGADYGKSSSDRVEVNDSTIKIILRNALRKNNKVKIKLTNAAKTIRDLNNQQLITEEIEMLTN